MIEHARKRKIQVLTWIFILGLVISGVTAYPLEWEINLIVAFCERYSLQGTVIDWLHTVREGIVQTNARYPFLAYGTDWLAFAHLVIAIAFWGVIKDPARNRWLIDWGMIASVLVIPQALITGQIREIPFFHQIVDCMFGVCAIPLLLWIRRLIKSA
jgi:hypothetical protein